MLVIRKQPALKYLEQSTVCLSESEFASMNNPHIDSEIQVFSEDKQLLITIPKSRYADLIIYPKSSYDGRFYIVDYSAIAAPQEVLEPVRTISETSAQIKATRASLNDEGFTYATSNFKNWLFTAGTEYIIQLANGALIKMRASRNGKTLYSGKLSIAEQQEVVMPQVGEPVVHNVVAVYKKFKQEI